MSEKDSNFVEIPTTRRFTLPIGLRKNDKAYRTGTMRLTGNDELIKAGQNPLLRPFLNMNLNMDVNQIGTAAMSGRINPAAAFVCKSIQAAMAQIELPPIVTLDEYGNLSQEDVGTLCQRDVDCLTNLKAEMDTDSGEERGESKDGEDPSSSTTG